MILLDDLNYFDVGPTTTSFGLHLIRMAFSIRNKQVICAWVENKFNSNGDSECMVAHNWLESTR